MSLREQVLRGGAFLVLRQGLGMGLAFVGVLLLTRIIGPTAYGLYATVFGVTFFLAQVARLGVDVYLVRQEEIADERVYHQAFTLVLVSSLALVALGGFASPVIAYWLGDARVLAPFWVMLATLPMTVLAIPAVAQLERNLDYRRVALLEVVDQGLYAGLSLVLALLGLGVWAPVLGYLASQAWLMGASFVIARYRPRWHWSRSLLRAMVGYGAGYSTAMWVWHLRNLANPLIVGRLLGPEGVGYVALALRLVEGLSFVKQATYRLSIAVLAKVQRDTPRLRAAMEEAMGLQVFVLGPMLAGVALVSPWLLPLLFGEAWRPVIDLFPFVALGGLVNAVFNMHSSVLFVLGRNRDVTLFHLGHIIILAAACVLLTPPFGLLGWGLAEVVALLGYALIHRQVSRCFGFTYQRALPWLCAFVPPLFSPLATSWPLALLLWLPALLVFISLPARSQIGEYLMVVRRRATQA